MSLEIRGLLHRPCIDICFQFKVYILLVKYFQTLILLAEAFKHNALRICGALCQTKELYGTCRITGIQGRAAIHSCKILIADDEFLIRWSLTQALSQKGYEVISVEDARKAIEAAKVQHFDFIITDLIMPESDGWEVLKMAIQTQPPPRVIIITARGNEETGRIAKEKGAWAYVEKPYIIDKIKEILNSSTF